MGQRSSGLRRLRHRAAGQGRALVNPQSCGDVARVLTCSNMTASRLLCITVLFVSAWPWPVFAQPTTIAQLPLKQLSIEELLEVDVSLPLRRDERVMDAPAAISVLTSEDLRRSGAVTLPEA